MYSVAKGPYKDLSVPLPSSYRSRQRVHEQDSSVGREEVAVTT